jgi:hypothetical protein
MAYQTEGEYRAMLLDVDELSVDDSDCQITSFDKPPRAEEERLALRS